MDMRKTIILTVFACLFTLANAQESELRFNQYGKLVNRTPLILENRDGILVFESKIKIIGYGLTSGYKLMHNSFSMIN